MAIDTLQRQQISEIVVLVVCIRIIICLTQRISACTHVGKSEFVSHFHDRPRTRLTQLVAGGFFLCTVPTICDSDGAVLELHEMSRVSKFALPGHCRQMFKGRCVSYRFGCCFTFGDHGLVVQKVSRQALPEEYGSDGHSQGPSTHPSRCTQSMSHQIPITHSTQLSHIIK